MINISVKRLLIVVCLFVSYKASAQSIITRGDTIFLQNGAKFWIGEQITLGNPSSPSGGYSFIYFPPLFHITKRKPLKAKYYGRTVTVKKFQKDDSSQGGQDNIIVLELGRIRYWCDVAPALDASEIINPYAGMQQRKHGGDNNGGGGGKQKPRAKKSKDQVIF